MNNLVSFETPNPFGAAVRLIYNSGYYNEQGIREEADRLEYNYIRKTNYYPRDKQEFCNVIHGKKENGEPITPIDVVTSRFFQSMAHQDHVDYHSCVVTYIIPEMLKKESTEVCSFSGGTGDLYIKEWLARFVETYVSRDEIMRSYNFQGGIISDPSVERDELSKKVLCSVRERRFTEKDFTSVICICRSALTTMSIRDENTSERLKFLGWYLTLFAMAPEKAQQMISKMQQWKGELFGQNSLQRAERGTFFCRPSASIPFGPAIRLIYTASHYSPEGLRQECDLLERNYGLTRGKLPMEKEAFCEYVRQQNKLGETIRPIDVVSSVFFQSMIHEKPPSFYYNFVESTIIPEMLKAHSEVIQSVPDDGHDVLVKHWMAMFVETIVPQAQIEQAYRFQGAIMPDAAVICDKIGTNLMESYQKGRLSRQDVELIIRTAGNLLQELKVGANNHSERLKFTGWYLTLFGMDYEDPCLLGEDVLKNLVHLKEKLFGHMPLPQPSMSAQAFSLPLVATAPPMSEEYLIDNPSKL